MLQSVGTQVATLLQHFQNAPAPIDVRVEGSVTETRE